ncbi:hypothetical protein ACHAXS_013563 [Conticribra weissflogii]
MKKKGPSPNLLLLVVAVVLPLPLPSGRTTALSYQAYNLRPKPDLQHELAHLASNEFSPPLSFATLDPKSIHDHDHDDDPSDDPHDDHNLLRRRLRSLVQCSSPLVEWSTSLIQQMGYSTYKELFDNQILQMPYIYKHYIDKDPSGESFGDGTHDAELLERHRRTTAFWAEADLDDSISVDDVLLLSMHGQDLLDLDKLVPTVMRMFDFDDAADVVSFASTIRDFVAALPEGGANPLLTMNAIATRAARRRDLPLDGIRDSIIVGDGVLRFLEDAGLTSSGPDFVHAHEFGHHVQFEMDMKISSQYVGIYGYEDDSRRREMMADAIAAYFLAHDRGGDMTKEEIEEFVETSYATGDCSVMDEDHHGTPEQRKCAAAWGASLAVSDEEGLVDPEMFARRFDEEYGRILALDGVDCTLVVEEEEEELDVVDEQQEEAVVGEEGEVSGGANDGTGTGVDIPYFQPPEITLNIDIPDAGNGGVQVIHRPEINLGLNLPEEESQSDEQEWEEDEEEALPEAAESGPYIPPQLDEQQPPVEPQEQIYVPPVVDVPQVPAVLPTQGQPAYPTQDEESIQQALPTTTTSTTQAIPATTESTSTSTAPHPQSYDDAHDTIENDPLSPPTEPQRQGPEDGGDNHNVGTLSDSYLRNRGSPSLSQSNLDYSPPHLETSTNDGTIGGDGDGPIVVKTIGPPEQTRSFNRMSGTDGFSSQDCSLPWVYCSPEMEEMAAKNGGGGGRNEGSSWVAFGAVVGVMASLC